MAVKTAPDEVPIWKREGGWEGFQGDSKAATCLSKVAFTLRTRPQSLQSYGIRVRRNMEICRVLRLEIPDSEFASLILGGNF